MEDDDLFDVFNEPKGAANLFSRPPQDKEGDTTLHTKETEYDGFCIDETPGHLSWRTVECSMNAKGYAALFQPLVSIPVPLLRTKMSAKDNEAPNGVLIDAKGYVAVAQPQKKPIGNSCFNCGEPGHNVSSCPKPRDNESIQRRRKEWDSGRAGSRPSWMDEQRYFVPPSENKVLHVKPGVLSSALCAALGMDSSHLVPPPYLGSMIREGYPPGYVDVAGKTEEGQETSDRRGGVEEEEEEDELRFICGGEEMDLSDDDEGAGGGGGKGASAGARQSDKMRDNNSRWTIMTVVYPGAFGAPPPAGVNPKLWDFSYIERERESRARGGANQLPMRAMRAAAHLRADSVCAAASNFNPADNHRQQPSVCREHYAVPAPRFDLHGIIQLHHPANQVNVAGGYAPQDWYASVYPGNDRHAAGNVLSAHHASSPLPAAPASPAPSGYGRGGAGFDGAWDQRAGGLVYSRQQEGFFHQYHAGGALQMPVDRVAQGAPAYSQHQPPLHMLQHHHCYPSPQVSAVSCSQVPQRQVQAPLQDPQYYPRAHASQHPPAPPLNNARRAYSLAHRYWL